MMIWLNIAYDEKETRGFIKRKAVGLALTLGLPVFMVFAVSRLVFAPVMLKFVGLGKITELVITVLRLPLFFAVAVERFQSPNARVQRDVDGSLGDR